MNKITKYTFSAEAQSPTEYTAWTREVAIEINDNFYYGTLSYDTWNGYDWDGDVIPVPDMDQNWFYELDSMTCDKVDCFGCEQNAKEAEVLA